MLDIISEFSAKLTQEESYQYVPKLRDYLIPYIEQYKGTNYDISEIFKDEFTKSDIINATVFYVEKNENVESLSAIDDYLIAINRLFDELLFNKYPNSNLMKYKPFASLSGDVQRVLKSKEIELKERESNPAINTEQFKFIINFLKNFSSPSLKFKQVSIIIKLFLLYGFSHDKIANMKVEDYCFEHKTIRVDYKRNMKRDIFLELPYTLAKEINEYLIIREDNKKISSNLLFVTGNNTEVKNGFLSEHLSKIKDEYMKNNRYKNDKNPFTPTGLQKYAIIKMIQNGMNQSIITDFSGQEIDIYNDCQNEVNRIKELDRNRYINHMVRGICTYDEI